MLSNLNRKNWQGISFKERDLTGVDFSHADIRGADFTNANLTNADFSYALAGLPRKWVIGVLIVAAILSGISGAATVMAVYRTVSFLIIKPDAPLGIIPAFLSFLFILSINIFLLLITRQEGLQKTLGILASVVAIGLPLLGILSSISNDKNRFLNFFRSFRMGNFVEVIRGGNGSEVAYVIVPLVMAVAATVTVIITLNLAVVLATFVGSNKEVQLIRVEALGIAVIVTGLVTRNGARYWQNLTAEIGVIVLAIILAIALISVSWNIAGKILREDEKYGVLRQIAIAISTLGGTSFRHANLTNANFSYATLKSTDFRNANTTRTLWHKSLNFNQARVGNTILINPKIRDLLITGNGHQQDLVNANLRGANLIRADLSYANLKAADLSEATFQDACLEWVNLTQTQAIGTDFTNSQITGACGLATWNIDSTTQLEWVDCRWIYLLEYPKAGTDDRERRPSSGEFATGEFTSLFQEVLHTVDLIFQNGIDWKAFISTFKRVQVENESTKLDVQSIENKGDGVVIVKVRVPPTANKGKLHSRFMQIYVENLKILEEKYQAELRGREEIIDRYHQQNADMLAVIKHLAARPIPTPLNNISDKLVLITFSEGDFATGFPVVMVQIWSDGHSLPIVLTGKLPPQLEIPQLYRQIQQIRNPQITASRIKGKKEQVTNVSVRELGELAKLLEEQINGWLNSQEFRLISDKLREKLNPKDEIRVILQSQNQQLLRLPWHLWDFFTVYRQAEIALSAAAGDRVNKSTTPRNKVRILAILGDSEGIDVVSDRQILEKLPDAETVFLVEPTREKLNKYFWDEQGWDILCFSGHSNSIADGTMGFIHINQTDKLSISELKNALMSAIERGLHLAIFNSCDGLGLAQQLDDLHIPQIIIWREPVPDKIAQEFLKNFLQAFSQGKSLYVSVRQAREILQGIEDRFSCASWLPVICQNQAEIPLKWREFMKDNQPKVEDLLANIQAALEAETSLLLEDKAEALEQINILKGIGQSYQSREQQKLVKTALRILKVIVAEYPDAIKLTEEVNNLSLTYFVFGVNYENQPK